uniref:Uncharacterized protein n=1 Tax=Siphoviridae sp. ctKwa30 TaxID=2825446 RepID=A0A8S5U9P0_9CAUD|nr:MAG TPA: hypothetical protein [Siphoviridae sp. ctKwa30]
MSTLPDERGQRGGHPPPRKTRRDRLKPAQPDKQTPGCKSRAGTKPAPASAGQDPLEKDHQ